MESKISAPSTRFHVLRFNLNFTDDDHAFFQKQADLSLHMAQTMRISVPPVRYSSSAEQMVVPPRRVELKPFQGQPRKYAGIIRLPQLVMEESKIANAGIGLFLAEHVRAGQVLTLYRRNRISEARPKKLKMKVPTSSLFLSISGRV